MASRVLLLLAAWSATLAQSQPIICPDAAGCIPEAAGDLSIDDTPTIQSAIKKCGDGGTILIPANTTYSIRSPLSFEGCNGCSFEVEGTLMVSDDVEYWSKQHSIFLMSAIHGASIYSTTGSGVINGNGQRAWDAFNADKSLSRPVLHSITAGSSNIVVRDLTVRNPPMFFFTVDGGSSGIHYSGLEMSAVSTSSNVAHNTDGFDIGASTNVVVSSTTVTNDDDCVAFKPGSDQATVTDLTCHGSHGVSIGSLGKTPGSTDTVSNILVSGIVMHNSTKAVGIKLWPGGSKYGTAVVSNVTFEHVTVASADLAVQITTCYGDVESASYCSANPSTAKISDVVFRDFHGLTSTKFAPTVANLDCTSRGTCGIQFEQWAVDSPAGTAVVLGNNVPSSVGISSEAGASG